MKRNNFWRWVFVLFVVVWAIYELIPPTDRNLITVFEETAVNKDETFGKIVTAAREKQAETKGSGYTSLMMAAAGQNLNRYFPEYTPEPDSNTNAYVLNKIQRKAAGRVRLGIDLKGGTSFLLGMDTAAITAGQTNQLAAAFEREAALSQAVEVLRRRVDTLGVAEPIIQPVGEDRILIQLPGMNAADMDSARRQIQRAAFLEFRLVHPQSASMIAQGLIVPGYEILTSKRLDKLGNKIFDQYLVERKPVSGIIDGKPTPLSGKHVKRAYFARQDITGQPEILFEFDSEGGDIFGQVTRANVNRQLAIVLDGELASAPNINEPILGGRGSISGSYSEKEAFELANVLENPLQAPLVVLQEKRVDPTLGAETIQSGVKAALMGLVFVAVFMLVYYMVGGAVANAALMLNIIILFGVLCSINATLTLPGIAGIVLTIGMAVDANVLIFERIREELKAGKSLRGSVAAGYDKAFSTIFDANITTLIASIILIFMGSGPVKGFGVTLTVGIMVSMFTALVFTRLIFDLLLEKDLIRNLKMLSLFGHTQINFLKLAKPAFILSWLIILGGIGYGIFVRGENVLNQEFKGGVEVAFDFNADQRVDQDRISTAIRTALGSEPTVQYQKELNSSHETLAIKTGLVHGQNIPESEEVDRTIKLIVDTLTNDFPAAGFSMASYDSTGPTMGAEIQRSALIAVLLSLFGILLYVAMRYEFSFAVGAVIAVIHDVLMTIGIYFISGKQMSVPMIAAVMTIIGFSINDTIVIFDRIREDLKLNVRGSFMDLMNRALNETLSRTVITSGTTFLATLALFLFGGAGLDDFSFTFLVGIITGTYSSIYIACAIVLWWNKGQRPVLAQPAPSGPEAAEAPAGA